MHSSNSSPRITVVLSGPRSGSRLLGDFLNNHPAVLYLHEPNRLAVNIEPAEDTFMRLWYSCNDPVLVINIKYGILRRADVVNVVKKYSIIHLVRDPLCAVASEMLADPSTKGNNLDPTIVSAKLEEFKKWSFFVERELNTDISPFFTLSYEEMTKNNKEVSELEPDLRRRIFDFLKVRDVPVSTNRVKEHPPFTEIVGNWHILQSL